MKKTNRRGGFDAIMETDFLYLEDSCLQFSYFFIGDATDIKIVIKLREEVSFHTPRPLFGTIELCMYW